MPTRLPAAIEAELYALVRAAPPFAPDPRFYMPDAWRRPVALAEHSWDALTSPLATGELCSARSLALGRLLFNIYEQNGLYLPEAPLSAQMLADFAAYYDPALVAAGAGLRPALEGASLGWLDAEIDVSGRWDLATFERYVSAALTTYEAAPSAICGAIAGASRPREALRLWMIQVAPDFISEASQMARALPGNFGPAQSELMKIFIDEFGYGVHRTKHSTLFQLGLASVGLSPAPHAYFPWYLPTSLHMTNYFHQVTSTKTRWFEYLGALYWIEAVVPHYNRQFSALLRQHFGAEVDTQYFDEHVGIDLHHRRQVLRLLICPAIERHGDAVLPDILRGVAAARLLGELADEDYLRQLELCEALARLPGAPGERADHGGIAPRVLDRRGSLRVSRGEVEVEAGYFTGATLVAGAELTIPAGRLFGARPIGDARFELTEAP